MDGMPSFVDRLEYCTVLADVTCRRVVERWDDSDT
jgi:hypothetical protein